MSGPAAPAAPTPPRSSRGRATTAYLLTCAAIGVAGGVMLWGAGWISTVLFATVPFVSVAIAGLWLLPATVALRLLERPFAGILVGLISGLVVFPFLGAAIWWAFFAELAFLVTLYRSWRTWQYYAGAVFVGAIYPVLAAASFDVWAMQPWALSRSSPSRSRAASQASRWASSWPTASARPASRSSPAAAAWHRAASAGVRGLPASTDPDDGCREPAPVKGAGRGIRCRNRVSACRRSGATRCRA